MTVKSTSPFANASPYSSDVEMTEDIEDIESPTKVRRRDDTPVFLAPDSLEKLENLATHISSMELHSASLEMNASWQKLGCQVLQSPSLKRLFCQTIYGGEPPEDCQFLVLKEWSKSQEQGIIPLIPKLVRTVIDLIQSNPSEDYVRALANEVLIPRLFAPTNGSETSFIETFKNEVLAKNPSPNFLFSACLFLMQPYVAEEVNEEAIRGEHEASLRECRTCFLTKLQELDLSLSASFLQKCFPQNGPSSQNPVHIEIIQILFPALIHRLENIEFTQMIDRFLPALIVIDRNPKNIDEMGNFKHIYCDFPDEILDQICAHIAKIDPSQLSSRNIPGAFALTLLYEANASMKPEEQIHYFLRCLAALVEKRENSRTSIYQLVSLLTLLPNELYERYWTFLSGPLAEALRLIQSDEVLLFVLHMICRYQLEIPNEMKAELRRLSIDCNQVPARQPLSIAIDVICNYLSPSPNAIVQTTIPKVMCSFEKLANSHTANSPVHEVLSILTCLGCLNYTKEHWTQDQLITLLENFLKMYSKKEPLTPFLSPILFHTRDPAYFLCLERLLERIDWLDLRMPDLLHTIAQKVPAAHLLPILGRIGLKKSLPVLHQVDMVFSGEFWGEDLTKKPRILDKNHPPIDLNEGEEILTISLYEAILIEAITQHDFRCKQLFEAIDILTSEEHLRPFHPTTDELITIYRHKEKIQ